MTQTASLQHKGTKTWTTVFWSWSVRNRRNALETVPVGLQEGAGGLIFTVLCFPKSMHRSPRVRDNHTAAVLYEKKKVGRDENLFIVSVKQLKLMWS